MMGAPSKLSVTRNAAVLVRIFSGRFRDVSGRFHDLFAQAELLKLQKSGQFPDDPVRIKV